MSGFCSALNEPDAPEGKILSDASFFFRSDLVDWRHLRQRSPRDRLETAFMVMEREYGVTRLLDPEGEGQLSFRYVLSFLGFLLGCYGPLKT